MDTIIITTVGVACAIGLIVQSVKQRKREVAARDIWRERVNDIIQCCIDDDGEHAIYLYNKLRETPIVDNDLYLLEGIIIGMFRQEKLKEYKHATMAKG